MNAIIFLPNWLGDLTMATPALRAIRRHLGPGARLVGVMRPYLADVLGGTDWLDDQWYLDPRSADRRYGQWALVRRMRRERFDLAVLMPNSFRTAFLAWLGRAKQRIGYSRYARGPWLTVRVEPPRERGRVAPEPVVTSYMRLAQAVGCPDDSLRLELATTPRDEESAERVWEGLGLRRDGRVVLLNSSGAYGAAKLWPAEHFADLARQIVDRLDHDVLVMCGPKERGIAQEIANRADRPRVFSMAEQPLDLGTAKACIRRGALMVSTDSGPRHVAAAFGKPVVTLFGPMLPIWSENPTQRAVHLVLDLDCIGCGKRVCPRGHHRCMRELSPAAVFAETARLAAPGDPADLGQAVLG